VPCATNPGIWSSPDRIIGLTIPGAALRADKMPRHLRHRHALGQTQNLGIEIEMPFRPAVAAVNLQQLLPPGSGGRSSPVEETGHHCPAPLSPGIHPYFGSNSLLNSFDFKKLRSSFELASWMTILAFFPPGAAPGEHRVAHPSSLTQVAMHPPVQVIVHVGWSSIVHVDA
jgi:hypothetical protein